MSIYKNLKIIAVSSAKAISTGVELAAAGASELEKTTYIACTKIDVKNIARALEMKITNHDAEQDIKLSFANLEIRYTELLERIDSDERPSISFERDSVLNNLYKMR